MTQETHLTDEDLAAYVDGELDIAARTRIEGHLLACDECRNLVSGAGQLLPPPARRTRRIVMLTGGLAAAAVLVLMLVPRTPAPDPASQTRDAEVVGPTGLNFAADAPPANASVRVDTLVFRWTAIGEGTTYQLTVSDPAGAIVWTEQTTRTSLALPESAVSLFEPEQTYYWRVDALLPDLRSATTGPRRLIALPP